MAFNGHLLRSAKIICQCVWGISRQLELFWIALKFPLKNLNVYALEYVPTPIIKGNIPLKYITGVSPAWILTFVSYSIIVDKGFLIDLTCNKHFIKSITRHFLRKTNNSQKRKKDLTLKARTHIDRVNQIIKTFNVLNVPWSCTPVPTTDDIIRIICGVVNQQHAILADDNF